MRSPVMGWRKLGAIASELLAGRSFCCSYRDRRQMELRGIERAPLSELKVPGYFRQWAYENMGCGFTLHHHPDFWNRYVDNFLNAVATGVIR